MHAHRAEKTLGPVKAALFYTEEEYVRRNRIVEKLAERGIEVTREQGNANPWSVQLRGVDIVVVFHNNMQTGPRRAFEDRAKSEGLPFFIIDQRSSDFAWKRIDAFVASRAPAVPASASSRTLTASVGEILVAKEKDDAGASDRAEARAWEQKAKELSRDLEAARAQVKALEEDAAVSRAKLATLPAPSSATAADPLQAITARLDAVLVALEAAKASEARKDGEPSRHWLLTHYLELERMGVVGTVALAGLMRQVLVPGEPTAAFRVPPPVRPLTNAVPSARVPARMPVRIPRKMKKKVPSEQGAKLRSLRMAADLTQPQLSKRANVSRSTISGLEAGLRQECSSSTWKKLMKVLESA